jgi:hypothetical protein
MRHPRLEEATVPDITGKDWGEIHAMAWRGDKVTVDGVEWDFRELLETNPRAAVDAYSEIHNKPRFERIVNLPDRPRDGVSDEFLPFVNPFPPSCC